MEEIGAPGVLVGPFDQSSVEERAAELGPGDAVVLYTDGVPEARTQDGVFGHDRLMSLSGRGLFLLDQLADRWGLSSEGTSVWFELGS